MQCLVHQQNFRIFAFLGLYWPAEEREKNPESALHYYKHPWTTHDGIEKKKTTSNSLLTLKL